VDEGRTENIAEPQYVTPYFTVKKSEKRISLTELNMCRLVLGVSAKRRKNCAVRNSKLNT
jgi:hypothetical protein